MTKDLKTVQPPIYTASSADGTFDPALDPRMHQQAETRCPIPQECKSPQRVRMIVRTKGSFALPEQRDEKTLESFLHSFDSPSVTEKRGSISQSENYLILIDGKPLEENSEYAEHFKTLTPLTKDILNALFNQPDIAQLLFDITPYASIAHFLAQLNLTTEGFPGIPCIDLTTNIPTLTVSTSFSELSKRDMIYGRGKKLSKLPAGENTLEYSLTYQLLLEEGEFKFKLVNDSIEVFDKAMLNFLSQIPCFQPGLVRPILPIAITESIKAYNKTKSQTRLPEKYSQLTFDHVLTLAKFDNKFARACYAGNFKYCFSDAERRAIAAVSIHDDEQAEAEKLYPSEKIDLKHTPFRDQNRLEKILLSEPSPSTIDDLQTILSSNPLNFEKIQEKSTKSRLPLHLAQLTNDQLEGLVFNLKYKTNSCLYENLKIAGRQKGIRFAEDTLVARLHAIVDSHSNSSELQNEYNDTAIYDNVIDHISLDSMLSNPTGKDGKVDEEVEKNNEERKFLLDHFKEHKPSDYELLDYQYGPSSHLETLVFDGKTIQQSNYARVAGAFYSKYKNLFFTEHNPFASLEDGFFGTCNNLKETAQQHIRKNPPVSTWTKNKMVGKSIDATELLDNILKNTVVANFPASARAVGDSIVSQSSFVIRLFQQLALGKFEKGEKLDYPSIVDFIKKPTKQEERLANLKMVLEFDKCGLVTEALLSDIELAKHIKISPNLLTDIVSSNLREAYIQHNRAALANLGRVSKIFRTLKNHTINTKEIIERTQFVFDTLLNGEPKYEGIRSFILKSKDCAEQKIRLSMYVKSMSSETSSALLSDPFITSGVGVSTFERSQMESIWISGYIRSENNKVALPYNEKPIHFLNRVYSSIVHSEVQNYINSFRGIAKKRIFLAIILNDQSGLHTDALIRDYDLTKSLGLTANDMRTMLIDIARHLKKDPSNVNLMRAMHRILSSSKHPNGTNYHKVLFSKKNRDETILALAMANNQFINEQVLRHGSAMRRRSFEVIKTAFEQENNLEAQEILLRNTHLLNGFKSKILVPKLGQRQPEAINLLAWAKSQKSMFVQQSNCSSTQTILAFKPSETTAPPSDPIPGKQAVVTAPTNDDTTILREDSSSNVSVQSSDGETSSVHTEASSTIKVIDRLGELHSAPSDSDSEYERENPNESERLSRNSSSIFTNPEDVSIREQMNLVLDQLLNAVPTLS